MEASGHGVNAALTQPTGLGRKGRGSLAVDMKKLGSAPVSLRAPNQAYLELARADHYRRDPPIRSAARKANKVCRPGSPRWGNGHSTPLAAGRAGRPLAHECLSPRIDRRFTELLFDTQTADCISRSARHDTARPVLRCPVPRPTVKSAMKGSTVSPLDATPSHPNPRHTPSAQPRSFP